MVRRSTSQPQAFITQRNSLTLSAGTEHDFRISAASGEYDLIIISESDNNSPVRSTEESKITADDESSDDLTPEEIEDLRESFREIKEGKFKVYKNADALIRDLKSDKD